MAHRTRRQLQALTRNNARFADAGRRMASTALAAREMATAAGKVVSYRTAMMAEAVGDPVAMTNPEFTLMGSEKVQAATQSAMAAADGMRALFDAWMMWANAQAQAGVKAAVELGSCRTPADLLDVQRHYLETVVGGTMASGSRLAVAVAKLMDASLAPIHTAAAGNARRLGGRRQV